MDRRDSAHDIQRPNNSNFRSVDDNLPSGTWRDEEGHVRFIHISGPAPPPRAPAADRHLAHGKPSPPPWHQPGNRHGMGSSFRSTPAAQATPAAKSTKTTRFIHPNRGKPRPVATNSNTTPLGEKRTNRGSDGEGQSDPNKRRRVDEEDLKLREEKEKVKRGKQALANARSQGGQGFVDPYRLADDQQFNGVSREDVEAAMPTYAEELETLEDEEDAEEGIDMDELIRGLRAFAKKKVYPAQQLKISITISSFSEKQMDNFIYNMHLAASDACSRISVKFFTAPRYPRGQMAQNVKPGDLVWCAIIEPLMGRKVGAEEQCRVFSYFGTWIVKEWPCLVLSIDVYGEVELLVGYSFGGTGKPKVRPVKEYFRLTNYAGECKRELPDAPKGMQIVEFRKESYDKPALSKPLASATRAPTT